MSTHRFRAAAAFSGNPDARAFFHRFPEDIRFDAEDPREFDMRSAVCLPKASNVRCCSCTAAPSMARTPPSG